MKILMVCIGFILVIPNTAVGSLLIRVDYFGEIGSVGSVSNGFSGAIFGLDLAVGMPVSGSFYYSTGAPLVAGNETTGALYQHEEVYSNPLQVGGNQMFFNNKPLVFVDAATDGAHRFMYLTENSGFAPLFVNGEQYVSRIDFVASDDSGTAFFDAGLPTALDSSDFDSTWFQVQDPDSNGIFNVNITSFRGTAVPESSSFVLLSLLGCVGLIGIGKRSTPLRCKRKSQAT